MARHRSAIIACGIIARCHARGWQGVPEVELAAIADSNRDALDEFGEFFGVPPEHRHTDYRLPLKTLVNPLQLMIDSGDLPVEWPGAFEQRARVVRGEAMEW